MAVKRLIDGGAATNYALSYVLNENPRNIGILITMAKIYGDKIPSVIVDSLQNSKRFHKRFHDFVSNVQVRVGQVIDITQAKA